MKYFIGTCLVVCVPLFSMNSYVPYHINYRTYIIIPRDYVGFSLLHVAVHNGDIKQTRNLLDAGEDITAKIPSGDTVLHMAAADGHTSLLRFLLERLHESTKKIDINESTKSSSTLYSEGYLLTPDTEYCGNQTPLHKAVLGGVDTIELLLRHGANVHVRDEKGKTPLFYAIIEEDRDVIKALLHAGATFEEIDKDLLPATFKHDIFEKLTPQQDKTEDLPPHSVFENTNEHSSSESEEVSSRVASLQPKVGLLQFLKNKAFNFISFGSGGEDV